MSTSHEALNQVIGRNNAVQAETLKLARYLVQRGLPNTAVLSADANAVSSTTLAATGLLVTNSVGYNSGFACVGGRTYKFKAFLPVTVDGTNGIKIDINAGTATFSSLSFVYRTYTAAAIAAVKGSALTTGPNATTAYVLIEYEGTMVCSGAGSFGVRLAQNTSGATAATILAGAYLDLTEIATSAP